MRFIFTRDYILPISKEEMASRYWFNRWWGKFEPYHRLGAGDLVYFYETPNKCIVWETRVVHVERFPYYDEKGARQRLKELGEKYDKRSERNINNYRFSIHHKNRTGYCLFFLVEPLQKLDHKPDRGFDGHGYYWERADGDGESEEGLSLSRDEMDQMLSLLCNEPDIPTLDQTISDLETYETLLEALREANEKMAEVLPKKVAAVIEQTIRKDTAIVKRLKKACSFQCQFPGCGTTIIKKNGGFYIEVAHIVPVRDGGISRIGNLVVLCPNHHKEFDLGAREITEQTVEFVRGSLNGREFEIRLPQVC